jgi:hypothetical protein
VPNAAIRFRPAAALVGASPPVAPQGKKLVWVLRGGAPAAVVFDPGVSDGTYTEIKSGLTADLRVITEASGARAAGAGRTL